MFIALSNEETKKLAEQSTPVCNLYSEEEKDANFAIYTSILGWYRKNKLTTQDKLSTSLKVLSELLGTSPNYFKIYEGKTGVWGLSWEISEHSPNNKFIIYYSNRGLSIELHPKFRKDMIQKLLINIKEKLVKK